MLRSLSDLLWTHTSNDIINGGPEIALALISDDMPIARHRGSKEVNSMINYIIVLITLAIACEVSMGCRQCVNYS